MKHQGVAIAVLTLAIAGGVSTAMIQAQSQAAPGVPQPFPGAAAPRQTAPPATPAVAATQPAAAQPAAQPTTPAVREEIAPPLDVPVYPTAELIGTYDAGRGGQQYCLYGTNAAFTDIVAYYKAVLKDGGREIYKTPGMQQFELGRFREDQMAYPPSVVVKDYASDNSRGYLAVNGTTEKRYRTVIQIVPVR